MTFHVPIFRAALLSLLAAASLALLGGCCDHSCPAEPPTHPAAHDGKTVVRSPGPHQNG